MSELEREKPEEVIDFINNVMLPKGATESDIDEYASSEGYHYDELVEFHAGGKGKPTWKSMPEDYKLGEFSTNHELDRALAKRHHKVEQRFDQAKAGEITYPQVGMSAAAQTVGKAVDFVAHETKGILGFAESMYRQYVPESAKEFAKDVGEPTGAALFEAQHKLGVDKFLSEKWDDLRGWWDELTPNERKFAEEAGVVSTILPTRQAVSAAGEVVSKTTSGVRRTLGENIIRSDFDKTLEFIRPRKTGDYLKEIEGRTDASRKYTPSTEEVRMAQTAKKVKGFKAGGNDFKNKDAIVAREGVLQSKLDTDLRKFGTKVSEGQLSTITKNLDELVKGKSKFNDNMQGVTGNQKAAGHLTEIRRQIQKKADVENKGVVDSWVIDSVRKDLKGDINFKKPTADKFNPDNEILRSIYNSLNDVTDATTFGKVKNTRLELSDIIKIKENSVDKLARTVQDTLSDTLNVIGKAGRMRWAVKQLTDLAVKAAPVAGVAAVGTGSVGAATALTGAALGSLWVTGKIGQTRGGRVLMFKLVGGLDKAAKTAKNAEDLVKIKRSKTTLLKMLAASQASSNTGEDNDR